MVWPPAPLQTAIVRGHWENPVDGSDLIGTATLTPVNAAVSPDASLLFTQGPRKVTLVAGVATWSQVLLSDSPGLGTVVLYELRVDGVDWSDPPRLVELSSALVSGGVIDLKGVATVVPGPQVASYLLAATRGAPDGVASLGPDGLVPTSQLPASGGGVPASRQINSGTGLSGGGDLSADRTLSVVYGSGSGTAAQGNDARLSDARPPTAHGHPQSDVTGLVTALAGTAPRVWVTDPMYVKYGIVAASGRFHEFMDAGGFSSQMCIAAVVIPAGVSFSRMVMPIRSAGVFTPGSGKPNCLMWWNAAGQFQQQTPNDDHMWETADWYVANLPTTTAAQGTDRLVYAGFQISGYAGGGQYTLTKAIDSGGIPFSHAPGSSVRLGMYSGAVTAFADINPATFGVLTAFIPFIGFMP